MDHDRMAVGANPDFDDVVPAPHSLPHDSTMPSDKGDMEDLKEKDTGYNQTTLDIESVEDTHVLGDPLDLGAGVADEPTQFTLRAVFVGCCLGAVVQASNLYLGLKTGFTFGPQLLGALGGFLILKPLSRVIPKNLPAWVGVGNFGPRENVTCQTAATAAGGLGILFVSGFPAMYQVGLLSPLPSDDIGHLIGYMFAVAFYGMSFAIPLRAFFILRQRLVFPTPSATAYAIRSLHATGAAGAEDAKRKGKWLFWTFLVCFIQKTVSTYIPGIIYDWHFFYWIAGWGAPKAQLIENWGWYFEITPAFLGAGILSGMNASWSFYGGTILAWGIIGPALVATGHAAGRNLQAAHDTVLPYRNYYNMSPADPSGNATSPRYCMLWIGVLVMLVAAFVELACEWKTIGAGMAPGILKIRNIFRKRSGKEPLVGKVQPLYDPAPKKDQVPAWIWGPMSLVAVIITCVVLGVSFDVNVGLSLLGVVLSVIFCFIGVLSAGATDINPVSTVAKATQLIFGGATKGKYSDSIDPTTGWNLKAMRINLLAGMVAAGAAAQATDMTGDLKTGHLIGAKPIAQYFAQLVGAFCSIFLTVAFFILFTKASPCILDRDAETCQYSVPSAAAWYAVAIVVTTTGGLPIPKVAGILAIVFAILGGALIVYRVYYCPAKYKVWVPNPSAVGLAFVLNATTYSSAMAIGATAAYFWKKRKPQHYEAVAFALAAGMLVGEGLGGVMQAILTIAGAGPEKGVTIGVPEF